LAAKHGILVFFDPMETAGWLTTLRNNGRAADYSYGQYLGNRYQGFANVAWISGNDFSSWSNSGDDALVLALARGIKSAVPGHIQTVEFNPPTGSSLDDPAWAPIVSINGAYVYGPTYIQVLHNYNQKPVMPTFLMEAHYELENIGRPPDFGTPSVRVKPLECNFRMCPSRHLKCNRARSGVRPMRASSPVCEDAETLQLAINGAGQLEGVEALAPGAEFGRPLRIHLLGGQDAIQRV
jgi:hypothetical protein